MSQDYIRNIEEYTFRARPALQTRHYDGWVLRFAEGYTRGRNSVNPIYESSLNVLEKISTCEAIYQDYGLPTRFKITSAAQPENLENILIERGYIKEGNTSVQTLNLLKFQMKTEAAEVKAYDTFNDDWLKHLRHLDNVDTQYLNTMRKLFVGIQPQACYTTLKRDEEVVALGLGVREDTMLGLFNIVTQAGYRRRGLGRIIVTHLLNWGKDQGAKRAYLQVEADNYPALSLYAHLGFHEVYQYWYRTKTHAQS